MSYSSFADFKGQPAKIRWFDNLSGEGMVRLANGECVYFHYSSVEGSAGDRWITFPNSGHDVECEVEIFEDSTFRQVNKLRSPHTIIEARDKTLPQDAIYLGSVLWFDDREGHGIITDVRGNETYVDVSVIQDRMNLKRNQLVSFELNSNIRDTRCAYKVKPVSV